MRIGGGVRNLRSKLGEALTEDEAAYELIVQSVLEYEQDRWGLPDFGTRFMDAVDLNTDEAVTFANSEAYKGASRVDVIVQSVNTTVDIGSDTDLTTEILATQNPAEDVVRIVLPPV